MSPEAAAKRELKALLTDHFAPGVGEPPDPHERVAVFRGPPPTDSAARQVVWIAGHTHDDVPASLRGEHGPVRRSTLTVDVMVEAYDDGDQPDAADDAALDLGDEVRRAIADAIKARRDLDHPQLYWAWVSGGQGTGALPVDGGGWSATVAVQVQFTSRIR